MNVENNPSRVSSVPLWLVVWLLLLSILLQGHFAFKVVGDLGQPTWDFGIVRDVPGQSPYAIYQLLPHPQHIMGREGE
jgi:hypothetical protein